MSSYKLRPLPKNDETVLAAYSPLVRQLLLARDITSDEDADVFLNPNWERDTHAPFLMKDMEKVCKRVTAAMEKNEKIAIWSDYDMDGIPGAVVLWDFFQKVGYDNVVHHTPHRNIDGFGLNEEGIDLLVVEGVKLVITIDCGIGDVSQVAYANKKGVEVVVTDHHIPGETLPKAYAVLNPKQKGCEYPENMLCGAGVIFKLVQGLLIHLGKAKTKKLTLPAPGWEKWLLDMAGMATVADMVPLTGENRVLAHFGLVVLKKSKRPGLQALLRKARANQRYLTEDDIGFTIAPRINAASRMGHATDAFKLLSTEDLSLAGELAEKLDQTNTKRKTLVATMKREIKRRLEKLGEPKEVIVLGNPEWKPSLLGLVAGGLAEEYERPVFLWGREEGVCIKGSCRSYGSVSVYEVMKHASDHFIEFGGHTAAGGFSVEEERVHALEGALVDAHKKAKAKLTDQKKWIDAELGIDDVTWDIYRSVSKLAPFGMANPKPLFLFSDVVLAQTQLFGKGKEHLKLVFEKKGGGTVEAISFFSAPDSFTHSFHERGKVTFVAHLEASYFRGRPELRLRLIDILPSSPVPRE